MDIVKVVVFKATKAEAMSGKPVPVANSSQTVEWNGENLLSINASSIAKYGRKVGQKLWSEDEIVTHMISPKKVSGVNPRKSFDSSRKDLWEGNKTQLFFF